MQKVSSEAGSYYDMVCFLGRYFGYTYDEIQNMPVRVRKKVLLAAKYNIKKHPPMM